MGDIGSRIKKYREENGFTQEDLARAIGTSKQAIFKYEKGVVTNIPLDKVEMISAVLNVSPAELVGWVTETPKSSLSENEERLLEAYRQADPLYRTVALEMLETHPANASKANRA